MLVDDRLEAVVGRSRFAADSKSSIANSSILTCDGRAEEPEQEEKLRLSPALNPGRPALPPP
jgi:hypothetical protein